MTSLLDPASHLSVCFYVESQGAQSKAEPLFHDVDIAAHPWSGQVFPLVSSTGIPATIIGSKGHCIVFFYKTVNIFRTNTQTEQMNERDDRGDINSVSFEIGQSSHLSQWNPPMQHGPGTIPLKLERLSKIKVSNVLSCMFEILYETKMLWKSS